MQLIGLLIEHKLQGFFHQGQICVQVFSSGWIELKPLPHLRPSQGLEWTGTMIL